MFCWNAPEAQSFIFGRVAKASLAETVTVFVLGFRANDKLQFVRV